MSGMFDNYNIPSNKNYNCILDGNTNVSNRPNKPFESYDEEGNVIGY
ncbi:hypothetical protein [uncultured Clostridium sp.]|nr:hypothetical protein [uncultured Clostridium sp.]